MYKLAYSVDNIFYKVNQEIEVVVHIVTGSNEDPHFHMWKLGFSLSSVKSVQDFPFSLESVGSICLASFLH